MSPAPTVNTGIHFTLDPTDVVVIFEGGTVPAGQTTAVFRMKSISTVAQPRTATITAELGGGQASAPVTVVPLVITVTVNPSTLVAGAQPPQSADLTISLSAPVVAGAVIHTSTNSGAAIGPGDVRLTNGQQQTFPDAVGTAPLVFERAVVTLTASFGVNQGTTMLAVLPPRCLSDPTAAGCEPLEPPPPPLPSPKLLLKATITGGPSEGPVEVAQGETRIAQFPLGSTLALEAFKENGAPVQSSFMLESATVDQGDLDDSALFRGQVVLQFGTAATASQSFWAIHRGEATFTVDPTEDGLPTVRVKIVVYQSGQLGGVRHTLDSSFFVLAHRYGVPPQFIKAQVEKEAKKTPDKTDYVRESYRYEPLNVEVGDLNVSRGQNLRARETAAEPFGSYRLATVADALNHTDTIADNKDNCDPLPDPNLGFPDPECVGLDEGNNTIEADKTPRVQQQWIIGIWDPQTGQILGSWTIKEGDEFVSARDIFHFNDIRGAKMNWRDHVPRSELADRTRQLNFTAQTSLAASYGLFQVMYVTAIQEKKWPGTPLGRNPSFLFDTEENIQAGGGTLTLGMTKVRDDYGAANEEEVDRGEPASEARLKQLFRNTYKWYNKKKKYPTNIVDERAPGHRPTPNRSIFPSTSGGEQ